MSHNNWSDKTCLHMNQKRLRKVWEDNMYVCIAGAKVQLVQGAVMLRKVKALIC